MVGWSSYRYWVSGGKRQRLEELKSGNGSELAQWAQ
jgi:hypothetical protein